jgi:hypothetical protein
VDSNRYGTAEATPTNFPGHPLSHPAGVMCRVTSIVIFGHVTEHFDVIIVGSGAGGGTLAHLLAPSGQRILLLERGNFLPRETENWNPGPVFVDGRYISPDPWVDADGKAFQAQATSSCSASQTRWR